MRPEGTIDLHLKKTIGGDESTLDTVAAFTTAAADATIRLRGVALGTRITVKAWKVGEPEPDWQIAEDARDPAVERALDPYMTLYLSSGATATHPYFADNFSIRAAR